MFRDLSVLFLTYWRNQMDRSNDIKEWYSHENGLEYKKEDLDELSQLLINEIQD